MPDCKEWTFVPLCRLSDASAQTGQQSYWIFAIFPVLAPRSETSSATTERPRQCTVSVRQIKVTRVGFRAPHVKKAYRIVMLYCTCSQRHKLTWRRLRKMPPNYSRSKSATLTKDHCLLCFISNHCGIRLTLFVLSPVAYELRSPVAVSTRSMRASEGERQTS